MTHSPGFSKPTHGYGTPFGGPDFAPAQLLGARFDTPDHTGEVIDAEALDDENWAGKGFEQPYEEA